MARPQGSAPLVAPGAQVLSAHVVSASALTGYGRDAQASSVNGFDKLLQQHNFASPSHEAFSNIAAEASAALREAQAVCEANIAAIKSALAGADPDTRDTMHAMLMQAEGTASMLEFAGTAIAANMTPAQAAAITDMAATAISMTSDAAQCVHAQSGVATKSRIDHVKDDAEARFQTWQRHMDNAISTLSDEKNYEALKDAMGEDFEEWNNQRKQKLREIEDLKKELARTEDPETRKALQKQIETETETMLDETIEKHEDHNVPVPEAFKEAKNALKKAKESGAIDAATEKAANEVVESHLVTSLDDGESIRELNSIATTASKAAENDQASIEDLAILKIDIDTNLASNTPDEETPAILTKPPELSVSVDDITVQDVPNEKNQKPNGIGFG